MHAALHLEHVLHRVHRPGVARVQAERVAADVLGALIVRRLLEAEGVHAEQEAVAGHLGVPVRKRLRHVIAQQDRVAEVEVDEVGRLDRDQVARVLDRDRAVQVRGVLEAALRPGARGGDVRLLAGGGAVAEALDGRDARLDQGKRALLRGHDGEVGAQRMRHREVRIGGERGVERRERIAEIAERLAGGELVAVRAR